jgi:ferredoxin--NADP+ reductase
MTRKIAIIGSGPSAFYAAQALFKADNSIIVDMFEMLPTPYGLLRGGVAPDHQQMKSVSKSYDKIADHPNFRFFGNVTIGNDISIDELKHFYHHIIIAIGAQTDKQMNIPGENSSGSHTATEFVGWYNGQPTFQNRGFNLSGSNAIVIGQGNVAVDVARILSKPVDELAKTDITSHALSHLATSKIKDIYMIGRRGPVQSAFTELELKELGKIEGVNVQVHDSLLFSDADSEELSQSLKARKNVAELMAIRDYSVENSTKTIHLMFYLSPTEIVQKNNKVSQIVFQKNKLTGDAGQQRAEGTNEFITLDCDILFRSIGYRGVPLSGVPFDAEKGIIPNRQGAVINSQKSYCDQLFVTGWIKRGPSGVIGTNRSDSIETVTTLLNQPMVNVAAIDRDIESLLNQKNITFISFTDWKIIDEYEKNQGQKVGKPREKITSITDALKLLNKS